MSADFREIKRAAGRLGGLATVNKHGRQHMSAIGQRGAAVTWKRYKLVPMELASYAMVDRQNGRIVAVW